MQFRHERKYVLSAQTADILRGRIAAVMQPDAHTGGVYVVNSLYLDDQCDSFYYEKLNGRLVRDKLRVRYYNDDLSFIRLERKHKEGELIHKESVSLTEEQYHAVANGDFSFFETMQSPLAQELCILHRLRRLRPTAAFSYKREAFVYSPGNVRITFDSGIGRHNSVSNIVNTDIGRDGYFDGIMELKYDGFLPGVITGIFSGLPLTRTEMSKYCYIRERGIRRYV